MPPVAAAGPDVLLFTTLEPFAMIIAAVFILLNGSNRSNQKQTSSS